MNSTILLHAASSQTLTPGAGGPVASTNDLALIVVLTFLALVLWKEAIGAGASDRGRDLHRGLNIGIVPLGLATAAIVGLRLAQLFS
jgi:hypothetical protein